MLYFERTKQKLDHQEVVITSWLDKDRVIWRALAPRYVNVIHGWAGVTGTSREEAVQHLIARLAEHFAYACHEVSEETTPPPEIVWLFGRESKTKPKGKVSE